MNHEVKVDAQTAARARISIDRMLRVKPLANLAPA
jgi:quinolinate synthase